MGSHIIKFRSKIMYTRITFFGNVLWVFKSWNKCPAILGLCLDGIWWALLGWKTADVVLYLLSPAPFLLWIQFLSSGIYKSIFTLASFILFHLSHLSHISINLLLPEKHCPLITLLHSTGISFICWFLFSVVRLSKCLIQHLYLNHNVHF